MKLFRKIILIIILIGFASKLFSQDIATRTVTIKRDQNSPYVSAFDKIIFKSDNDEIIKTFNNVIATDSFFIFMDIPVGQYSVSFNKHNLSMKSLDIVVCSKCENEFEYFAVNDEGVAIWTIVTELPGYKGGDLALANDFQNSLSTAEKQILMKSSNISINFCVTKNNEVCDVAFKPDDLSNEIKAIISKGILNTKNWRHGKQHREPTNEMFKVDLQTLMEI